ncbi:hypothetical protein [Corallococcus sp. AB038B]|uniref:hypothetical protein n=1 Tax=Corallococcus sp. AB038B TaxID=2316718 RepID=UPI00131588A1|nr:hypothetical protein [Corallococcus sp. AB038B]
MIEGPKVRPETADPLVTLDLARAYFSLIQRVAAEHGDDLTLQGLFIRKGSTVVASRPNQQGLAIQAMTDVSRYVNGVLPPPPRLETPVKEFRGRVFNFPISVTVASRLGDQVRPLTPAHIEAVIPPRETVELRATVVGVGGANTTSARFASKSERRVLSLRTDVPTAQKLAHFLYSEVDITATVQRDEHGLIHSGVLDGFSGLTSAPDQLKVWREWFREVGGDWNDIDDVEQELQRV